MVSVLWFRRDLRLEDHKSLAKFERAKEMAASGNQNRP